MDNEVIDNETTESAVELSSDPFRAGNSVSSRKGLAKSNEELEAIRTPKFHFGEKPRRCCRRCRAGAGRFRPQALKKSSSLT